MVAIDAGMNIAEVEALGVLLRKSADDLAGFAAVLDRLVKSAAWQGAVATKFKVQWWPQHRTRLGEIEADVRGFGQSAANNASEQRNASDEKSGFTRKLPAPFPTGVENQHPQDTESRVVTFEALMTRGQALPPGEIEILRVSDDPPRYIVNLRGIDIGIDNRHWEQDHLQDLRGASEARLTGHDSYAERVELEMQRAGVPSGAEVMLVGHSAGAIAAMNMAKNRSFNQPGNDSLEGEFHVQVTHVLAAGAGLRDWVDDPPIGTNVLMAINRNDAVAQGIQVGDFGIPTTPDLGAAPRALVNDMFDVTDPKSISYGDGRIVMEFSANAKPGGFYHDYDNYELGLVTADAPANAWMDDAAHKYFAGGGGMQVVRVSLPDNIDYGAQR